MKSMVSLEGLIYHKNLICKFSCSICKMLPPDIKCTSFGLQPKMSRLIFLSILTPHKVEESLQGMKLQDKENNDKNI